MKMLITGTNGFIGRNLMEYFQERRKNVYCPKRLELDLLDSSAVSDYLKKHGFDIVINCAITTTSVEQNLKMYFDIEKCSGLFGKMINLGSGAEYDSNNYIPKMKEEYFGEHIPSDIYGFSKYLIAKDIEKEHRNIINLRLFGIYGKYENYKRRFISSNICRVLCNLNISINKNVFFDYLYIVDFLKIVEMFIKKDAKQRTYNVCTGKIIDLLTLAEIIKKIDGKGLPIIIKQDGLNPEYSGDNTRFLQEFGEFNFTEHEKAISELYRWYKDTSGLVFDAKNFV